MTSDREPHGIALLPDWTFLRVGGADAERFLQSQLTCDVAALGENGAIQAAWCNPKGRVVALFHVGRAADGFTLFTSAGLGEAILRRLRMYVLRAHVHIEPAGTGEGVFGVFGPSLVSPRGDGEGLPEPWQFLRRSGLELLGLPGGSGQRAIAGGNLADVIATVEPTAWQAADIRAWIPMVDENTTETFLPQMLNLDLGAGVSFRKGCYPGQEIVARTRYLGRVKQRMMRAYSHSARTVAPGSRIVAAGGSTETAGSVVQAAPVSPDGMEMLVVLRLESVGEELRLFDREGPALVDVRMPDDLSAEIAQG
jgi:tRNA-modifying protein YgfZ